MDHIDLEIPAPALALGQPNPIPPYIVAGQTPLLGSGVVTIFSDTAPPIGAYTEPLITFESPVITISLDDAPHPTTSPPVIPTVGTPAKAPKLAGKGKGRSKGYRPAPRARYPVIQKAKTG